MTKDEKKASESSPCSSILRGVCKNMTKDKKKASKSERKKILLETIKKKQLIEKSRRISLLEAIRNDRKLNLCRDLEECVPAIGLSIGKYNCVSGEDMTVTACFSYGKRCLQWDITEGPLRRRLGINWENIIGLDLKLNECTGLACLSVEVDSPPSCMEYHPKWSWISIDDFIGIEIWRTMPAHVVLFKPGTVDESYKKLSKYIEEQALLRKNNQQRFQEFTLGESLGQLSTSNESNPTSSSLYLCTGYDLKKPVYPQYKAKLAAYKATLNKLSE